MRQSRISKTKRQDRNATRYSDPYVFFFAIRNFIVLFMLTTCMCARGVSWVWSRWEKHCATRLGVLIFFILASIWSLKFAVTVRTDPSSARRNTYLQRISKRIPRCRPRNNTSKYHEIHDRPKRNVVKERQQQQTIRGWQTKKTQFDQGKHTKQW